MISYLERPKGATSAEASLDGGATWRRCVPITFTAENAQKCFDGSKTQTRRLMNPQPSENFIGEGAAAWFNPSKVDRRTGEIFPGKKIFGVADENEHHIPRYRIGDTLWIQEPWRTLQCFDGIKPSRLIDDALIHYEGTNTENDFGKLRPARFMPRRFSRPARYEVTGVKCERVNKISEADAMAEGCLGTLDDESHVNLHDDSPSAACLEFERLWNSIHTKPVTRFDDGPWVWAYEFRMVK